jgi:PAS domain-containing protein
MPSFPALAELLAEPKLAALILDPAPALVFDRGGALRFANRAAVSAYGAASLAELIEKSAATFGEMPETAKEFAETLPLNGPYRREAIALSKDTETFRCERIGLSNGLSVIVFTGLARERSDGNIAKAFAALIDGERAPFALFDDSGKPLAANRMATAIMGPAGTLLHLHASAAAALSDANLKGSGEIPFGVLKILLKKFSLGSRALLFASFAQPERAAAPQPEPQAKPEPVKVEEELREENTGQVKPKTELPPVIQLGPPKNDNIGWEVPKERPVSASEEGTTVVPMVQDVTTEEVDEFWAALGDEEEKQ